jgi:hypothetical protein
MKVPAEAVAGGAMPAEVAPSGRQPQRAARPPAQRQGQRPQGQKPAAKQAAMQAPKPLAKPAPRAERPAGAEGRKDRAWREADFRDTLPEPGMERRRRG